jgi:hypothetical protein
MRLLVVELVPPGFEVRLPLHSTLSVATAWTSRLRSMYIRSCAPLSCGQSGRLRSSPMPSVIHQTDRALTFTSLVSRTLGVASRCFRSGLSPSFTRERSAACVLSSDSGSL